MENNNKVSLRWKIAQWFEINWWKRYFKTKNVEEYLKWKATYWQDLLFKIEKHLPILEFIKILDAGCGPAGIFIVLKGNTVKAIDPLIDKYQNLEHFQPQRFAWTTFENTNLENLQEQNKYDVIFCMNAINHVSDIQKSYKNLVNAVQPNGVIIISTDAHKYSFLQKIFQFLPGDILHPHQYNIKEYEQFLIDNNCTIKESILHKTEGIFDYYITIAQKK